MAGHNWSPFLRGAGGRGISPATGALLVTAPAGAAVLLGGMAFGRLAHQTALGSFVADLALVPIAAASTRAARHAGRGCGRDGDPRQADRRQHATCPSTTAATVLRNRLLFDRDTWQRPAANAARQAPMVNADDARPRRVRRHVRGGAAPRPGRGRDGRPEPRSTTRGTGRCRARRTRQVPPSPSRGATARRGNRRTAASRAVGES